MIGLVGKEEKGDIRSLFEQALSLPQGHVRPTLRSRKSMLVGLGLPADITNEVPRRG